MLQAASFIYFFWSAEARTIRFQFSQQLPHPTTRMCRFSCLQPRHTCLIPLLQVRSFIPRKFGIHSQTLATHPSTFIPFLHSCACSKIPPALCAYCIGRSHRRGGSPLPPSLNSQSARAHKREKDPSK